MTDSIRDADVAVIGLGAAGGVAAYVLAKAGLEVVGLEAGPRLPASSMSLDEIRNDIRNWMSHPKSSGEAPTWRYTSTELAVRAKFQIMMVNGVGGTTVHYDAISPRFQPWQFKSRSRIIERYGSTAIPEYSTLTDWPISYEELEPYYNSVEYAIGVSGQAGNIRGDLISAGNPFEGPRSRDFPLPPARASGWTKLMTDAARSLGWHPVPSPTAINTLPYNGNPECTYCGFCQSNGCYRNAKGSTDVNLIRDAEASGNLRIQTSARAIKIEVGSDGRVSGVTFVRDGRTMFQPARAVLLGAFLYENIRLLLLSKSKQFPNGLSNNRDQVGRHFTAHLNTRAYGLFEGRHLSMLNGSAAQKVAVEDWNEDNFDHAGLGFVGGGQLLTWHETKPIEMVGAAQPGIPSWGHSWKDWAGKSANSIGRASASFENLPYRENILDLDPTIKDSFGQPVIRVTHNYGSNELHAGEFMSQKTQQWLMATGANAIWVSPRIRVEPRHPYGGTRMGTDPATSVVDSYGFSHEARNLGMVGASTFPSTSGHNPTLTLQALAWRTAEHLAANWKERSR